MSADITTYLLLTAAGTAMVGLTVPSLFESSSAAARTFKGQVTVLEQGASPSIGVGGFSLSGGGGGWNLNVNGGAGGGGVSAGVSGLPPPLKR